MGEKQAVVTGGGRDCCFAESDASLDFRTGSRVLRKASLVIPSLEIRQSSTDVDSFPPGLSVLLHLQGT